MYDLTNVIAQKLRERDFCNLSHDEVELNVLILKELMNK